MAVEDSRKQILKTISRLPQTHMRTKRQKKELSQKKNFPTLFHNPFSAE